MQYNPRHKLYYNIDYIFLLNILVQYLNTPIATTIMVFYINAQ